MRNTLTAGALMTFAVVASFLAGVPGESQAPAKAGANTTSRDQTKPSAKVSQSAGARKIPCKTPENAALCYWTHGRLSVYEGAVPYHIWKIGTRRLLGVFSGPSHYPAMTDDNIFSPEFPAELDRAYEVDNRRHKKATGSMWAIPPPIFADFEVCPLRSEKREERQPVCIESAKNIFVQDDDY